MGALDVLLLEISIAIGDMLTTSFSSFALNSNNRCKVTAFKPVNRFWQTTFVLTALAKCLSTIRKQNKKNGLAIHLPHALHHGSGSNGTGGSLRSPPPPLPRSGSIDGRPGDCATGGGAAALARGAAGVGGGSSQQRGVGKKRSGGGSSGGGGGGGGGGR